MTSSSSKLILIVLSLVLLVLVALLVFGLYEIKAKNREVSRIVNEADEMAKTDELIKTIKAIQENAADDLKVFDSFVLTSENLVSLIESVEEAGKSLKLETKIISVNEVVSKNKDEPRFIRMTIETTEGSWPSSLSFLRAIESLPHRVMMEEAGFSKDSTGWRLRLTILIHAFN